MTSFDPTAAYAEIRDGVAQICRNYPATTGASSTASANTRRLSSMR